MNRRLVRHTHPLLAVLLLLGSLSVFPVFARPVAAQVAQDEPAGEAPAAEPGEPEFPMPEMTEEEKKMFEQAMAIAGPGPEHEVLQRLAGSWDLTVRIWPSPGAAPIESVGTGEARLILGDRFLEWRSSSSDGPLSSEGLTILGFDRRHGRYTQVSYDTWATYYVSAAGGWNDQGDALVLSGEDYDPVMQQNQVYDFVYRFPDDDTWVTEIVFKDSAHTQGKGPHKMVEITGSRR